MIMQYATLILNRYRPRRCRYHRTSTFVSSHYCQNQQPFPRHSWSSASMICLTGSPGIKMSVYLVYALMVHKHYYASVRQRMRISKGLKFVSRRIFYINPFAYVSAVRRHYSQIVDTLPSCSTLFIQIPAVCYPGASSRGKNCSLAAGLGIVRISNTLPSFISS